VFPIVSSCFSYHHHRCPEAFILSLTNLLCNHRFPRSRPVDEFTVIVGDITCAQIHVCFHTIFHMMESVRPLTAESCTHLAFRSPDPRKSALLLLHATYVAYNRFGWPSRSNRTYPHSVSAPKTTRRRWYAFLVHFVDLRSAPNLTLNQLHWRPSIVLHCNFDVVWTANMNGDVQGTWIHVHVTDTSHASRITQMSQRQVTCTYSRKWKKNRLSLPPKIPTFHTYIPTLLLPSLASKKDKRAGEEKKCRRADVFRLWYTSIHRPHTAGYKK